MTVKARHRIKARTLALIALVSLLFGSALAVAVTPAQAAPAPMTIEQAQHAAVTTPCTNTPNVFCLSHDFYSNYVWAIAATVPRNTCFANTNPPLNDTLFATEHTGVQWWLFRTTTCGGSHIVVHSYTNLTLPVGWAGYIVGAMRTSTIGKAGPSPADVSLLSKADYTLAR